MSVTCTPEAGHFVALETSLSLNKTSLFLSHAARQSSSHDLPKDKSVGPELILQVWQVLFLVDICGEFESIP